MDNNVVEAFVHKAGRVVHIAARRRWLALGVATGVAVVCSVGILAVPERYQANARVYVDTQTMLKPLMADLTYQPDIDEQVGMLARTLISRPNMERLVSIPGLELGELGEGAREKAVSQLMERIKIVPTSTGNLFEISYRGASPEHARKLVEATVDMFVNANEGSKKQDSEDAGQFIEDQIRAYEAKLTESENRLKDFKIRNFGVTGVSNQDYFSRVSALTEQVSKLRIELSAAVQSRDAYRRELADEEPQLPMEVARSVDVAQAQERLQAQRKHLDELLRRYTDVHPDVISARRVLVQLSADVSERKQAEEAALTKSGNTGKAATSPVYQKLRISLAESEAQVASLRSQLSAQQEQLTQVRALAGRVPQVEAELAQLNRDYDIIRRNYDQMVARRESASLGVKLDESSQLAEFRLIEPPRVAPTPVFPARLHLAAIAVFFSLIAGVAAAILAELLSPTFDDASALREMSGRPVLGTVSMLVTPEGERGQRVQVARFASALGIVVVLQALWVAWIASRSGFG
ncbi:MAG: XrtA system polysaccharide chain length determinant [Burkholderiaceae bacterium]